MRRPECKLGWKRHSKRTLSSCFHDGTCAISLLNGTKIQILRAEKPRPTGEFCLKTAFPRRQDLLRNAVLDATPPPADPAAGGWLSPATRSGTANAGSKYRFLIPLYQPEPPKNRPFRTSRRSGQAHLVRKNVKKFPHAESEVGWAVRVTRETLRAK